MPKHIEKLMNLLPNLKEINEILLNENEAKYIFNKTLDVLHTETTGNAMENNDLEEVSFLIQALVDRCWERIHTGHFSEVSIELRKIYALACYFKSPGRDNKSTNVMNF
ncbi:uncharacterized protein ACRADG_003820 isoform 2-T3 [Cochliomyia hominivorax]